MIRATAYLLFLVFVLVLPACTGMKGITTSDPLYSGHEITYTDKGVEPKKITSIAQSVVKPIPNHTFLWMRPALARNNMLSDSAKTKKFWKKKVADPVLLSHANPEFISATIQDRVFHNGYFHNKVTYDTLWIGKRKAKYNYKITLDQPYTIGSVKYPKPMNDLTQKIHDTQNESLLQPGEVYTLDAVKNERVRIDRELKENGYIYFSPDFLMVKADSVTGDHQVNAEVTLKPETPPESKTAFTIGKIFIHDDHLLEDAEADTIQYDRYFLISRRNTLRFSALQQGIFLKPGELYSRSNYLHTIRYLNQLPIVRNANIKFLNQEKTDQLDVLIYLSQRKRFAYTAEFNTVFRSTNYFGPGFIFSYSDRNAGGGAEVLKINLRGSIEVQIDDGDVNPAYELGLGATYTFPKFFPGFLSSTAQKSLPKTIISVGYNLFNRLDLYRLNSSVLNFGYSWSKNDRMNHSFNPVEITFTRLPEESKSQEFEDYLEENPGVQRSFDEQFIYGLGYEFTYQSASGGPADFYFRGGIDASGNLLNTIYKATDAPTDSLGRYLLFGVPFSQYLRTRTDLHYSFKINSHSSLVSRISVGLGIPYGNSDILPYIKQFYVGGTNSLRSFIARSVGPGSEVPPEGYNDVTGDIRLEGNLEYRFDISGSLKGALFMDAGNIWLFNEDESRPNGEFRFDTFLEEIAISYGWGMRWDFDFIVARLDFAYTLRTPYLPPDERWAKGFSFWDPVINIAIGYPF